MTQGEFHAIGPKRARVTVLSVLACDNHHDFPAMNPLIVDFLFGSGSALLGAGAAWIVFRYRTQRTAQQLADCKARHAAEVLARLRDVAVRMAIDVGEHSSQVEVINEQLAASADREPGEIAEVVTSLVEANERMREKLATTENRLREQAQQIELHAAEARTDALTLLANRRAFDDELARRFAELRRHGRAFSLLMADVDHFKRFNDLHGHLAGDEVLRNLARLLRQKMREMDLVARYGGEEFAVILPGTDLQEACQAAQRIRQGIEEARFRYGGKDLQVTVSQGVAEASVDESEAALVTRADMALYASKQNGRNCVHAHDGRGIRRIETVEPTIPDKTQDETAVEPPPPVPEAPPSVPAEEHSPESDAAFGEARQALHELPSRTAFCQHVRARIAEWKRGGATCCVLLAGIDPPRHDEHRLSAGQRDAGTLALTQHFAATIREMDTLAYYAPGCVALLLPAAGIADAIRIAERLRETFSPAAAASTMGPTRPTISLAVAQVHPHDDTISLLRRAEMALEAAVRRGGNRVYYHDGERCVPITAFPHSVELPV